MNDIFDKFVGAYKEGTIDIKQEKVEPKSLLSFLNSNSDLESNSTRPGSA
jgi:hypothetical protein